MDSCTWPALVRFSRFLPGTPSIRAKHRDVLS